MPPRTIDNLGVEISTRYAEDQKMLDQKILKDSRKIPSQTEIEVTFPSFASELDQLFDLQQRNISWALFFSPPKYGEQKKRFFSHHILPTLGSDEKKRIPGSTHKSKSRKKKRRRTEKKKPLRWEEEKEKEEEEKEEKILLNLLTYITTLDKILTEINSRRTQYQKG